MRSALVVLALCVLTQEDARIRDWIRALEEESAAARDKAMASLIQAGDAAEPELKIAAQTGSTEARSRAAEALKAIAWRRHYDPPPRLVTLRHVKAPLKEVLADLAKQSGTPLKFGDLEEAIAAAPVTVRVENVPLWRALEAVCRAHGKVDYFVQCGWGKDPEAGFEDEPFAACPRVVDGTVELRLQSIITETSVEINGGRKQEKTSFAFSWHWEKGTRPLSARVEIDELRDDADASYADRVVPFVEQFRADYVPTNLTRTIPAVPPDGVTRFKVIKGALVVVLPLTVQEYVFEKPAEMIGVTRESRWGNVRLAEYKDGTAKILFKVETRPEELVDRLKPVLLDTEGKEYPGTGQGLGHMGDHGYWSVEVLKEEEDRKPGAVRCTAEVGRRERRIPFEFRDVRFR
jgi:hypothetical protein